MTSIQCPINRCALDHPDYPAIFTNQGVYSYKRLEQVVSSVSETLTALDIEPGQRVGVLSRNSSDYIITILALIRLGAVFCPVNSRLPKQSVRGQLERIACKTILSDQDARGIGEAIRVIGFESFVKSDLAESAVNQSPKYVDRLQAVDFSNNANGCKQEIRKLFFNRRSHLDVAWSKKPVGIQYIILNQKASIIFTSGSSGYAKAVLHSYANHWYNAKGANQNIKISPGDRWLLSLPLYHVGGLAILFRCFLAGAAVVVGRDGALLEDVFRDSNITHLSLVPVQLKRLLNNATCIRTLRNLKSILVGGQGVPTPLLKTVYENQLPVFFTYGCSEMASQVATTQSCESVDRLSTSGRVLRYSQIRIADDGEILLKGKALFMGYIEGNELILPVDKDGWYHTNDLGEIDRHGYLTVTGRKDTMFISGGENIYPEEIEKQLNGINEISESIVVPASDDEFGFRPVAFVKTIDRKKLDINNISERLRQWLPSFKIPVQFLEWPNSEETERERMKFDRVYFKQLLKT
jgi:O-succinylbenzoic acid--CoA ligase